jgi:hypothetical protein
MLSGETLRQIVAFWQAGLLTLDDLDERLNRRDRDAVCSQGAMSHEEIQTRIKSARLTIPMTK